MQSECFRALLVHGTRILHRLLVVSLPLACFDGVREGSGEHTARDSLSLSSSSLALTALA